MLLKLGIQPPDRNLGILPAKNPSSMMNIKGKIINLIKFQRQQVEAMILTKIVVISISKLTAMPKAAARLDDDLKVKTSVHVPIVKIKLIKGRYTCPFSTFDV